MTHRFPLRVYFEDTDLAGIVYYANYLKFIERGRSEWIRALGVDQMALREAEGIVFAVRRIEADYLLPARFGEDLTVCTTLSRLGGARIELAQTVERGATPLFSARVTLACLHVSGRAVRIPAGLRGRIARAPVPGA